MTYSVKKPSPGLITEILEGLKTITWGSLEIYVQKGEVTQITQRNIKKTGKK